MSQPELHRTLADLVAALEPPGGSLLRLDSAELTVPLEVTVSRGSETLIVLGRVPHSRWRSGFQPDASTGHVVVEAVPREVRP